MNWFQRAAAPIFSLVFFTLSANLPAQNRAAHPAQSEASVQAQNQSVAGQGAGESLIRVDASVADAAPETGFLHLGGRSSNGHDLEINSRYLMLDGKPMLPVMGEFHYSRYPEQQWEQEILKMKAGGVNVVSTYVFWIHHEEVEGQFDWSGQRDLRHFVELCGKHGMYVYLRVGPWDHGEVRNGGFPDWLLNKGKLRTNDPVYLKYVARYFDQIGEQVKGLLWKDGGPVIGAQLENEYGLHGAGAGAEHILKLKQLAMQAGITVPLYSVTGWPSLDFPPHDVIPVSGGYPDGFWYDSTRNLPPSPVYLFNLNRKLGDMGATSPSEDPTGRVDLRHDPYFAAEEGGGMATSYARRPLIRADDIASLALVGIGSGVNLYGYYMFHGGANPPGRLTTLQESQATKYPNDLPEINYDFQAPLGEYGQTRDSYRKTRAMHLFLNRFGETLAPMTAYGQQPAPKGPADTSVPRVAVRAEKDHGFVFVNNYVRQLAMPERPRFQAEVKLSSGTIRIPEHPISIPANSYFIWPINLKMGGATLRYSTAQLLTRIESPQGTTYFFFAVRGVEPEFAFDGATAEGVSSSRGKLAHEDGLALLRNVQPGLQPALRIAASDGKAIRIVLLSAEQAEQASVESETAQEHLVISPADVFYEGMRLDLRSTNAGDLTAEIYPAVVPQPEGQQVHEKRSVQISGWTTVHAERTPVTIPFTWTRTKAAGEAPATRMGSPVPWRKHPVAQVPEEKAWDAAEVWTLRVPEHALDGISDLWLTLDYAGDVGRFYIGNTLADDNFYNGTPWQIGLKRFLPAAFGAPLTFRILPLRAGAPIYLDAAAWKRIAAKGQTVSVPRISVRPEYEATFSLGSR